VSFACVRVDSNDFGVGGGAGFAALEVVGDQGDEFVVGFAVDGG